MQTLTGLNIKRGSLKAEQKTQGVHRRRLSCGFLFHRYILKKTGNECILLYVINEYINNYVIKHIYMWRDRT